MKTRSTLFMLTICASMQAQQVTLVKDIWPGNGQGIGMFHKPYIYNDRLYFSANDGQNGEEYWSSDGTDAGTVMLKDIHEGSAHAVPDYTQYGRYPGLMEFDGYLYFTADSDGFGEELWRTDGAASGTEQCEDINTGAESGSPTFFHVYKDMMFFTAYHPEYQREPYILRHSGGEPDISGLGDLYTTNSVLSTMWNTYNNEAGTRVVTFMDTLIFRWYHTDHGLETWITNGTAGATQELFDHNPLPVASGLPDNYTVLQDSILCFTASTSEGSGLWKMTPSTTFENEFELTLLQVINADASADFSNFHIHGDRLFFSADNPDYGQELWVSDGTTEGTYMVKDIMPGNNHSDPRNLVSFNGHVYFTVYDSNLDEYGHIWRTDGTEAGTVRCSDVWTSNINRSMHGMKWQEYNGKLYIAGYHTGLGDHYLCAFDGTSAGPQWIQTEGGSLAVKMPAGLNSFIEMDDALYFAASSLSDDAGVELYKLTDTSSSIATISNGIEANVYPNPATDVLTVQSNLLGKKAVLTVYDYSGKLVDTIFITQNTTRINTSNWPLGIYSLQLISEDGLKNFKVVKQ